MSSFHQLNLPQIHLPVNTPLSSQDTIIYAVSGYGTSTVSSFSIPISLIHQHSHLVLSDNGATKQTLSPGDFALIPAWTEHQEVNEGEEEVTWVITRGGGEPTVVKVSGWGGGVVEG
jgi:hypothetical protein